LGKFDAKAYEAIFVGYSTTSKAYRIFNRSSLTIEETMHVKFEESNVVVENVVEIDPLGEDMERLSLKDTPALEEKLEPIGDVQEDKEESTHPLPKTWRYATNHPKELILGDASKGVTTRSKLHDLCGNFAFISHFEPKSILEAETDSYWLLAM